MKVLLATDDKSLNSHIAKRFGHAEYYLIVDTETMNIETIKNPGHDDDHSIIREIAEEGVKIFVVGNIGPHAFNIINALGLKVMLARRITASEAINKLKNNKLKSLNAPTLKRSIHEHSTQKRS
jgi:predicted Fe-Mo cluster-binding NifX family protein